MTTPIPPVPNETQPWEAWGDAIDAAVRELQTIVQTLTPSTGLVLSVNSLTPDSSGNVALGATDVNAMAAGYKPQYSDLPQGFVTYVYKDATTGFWPASWNADGTANYTSGSASAGVRPHALPQPVIWVGAEPSPAQVSSGTGGMLQGYDERAIPNP